MAVWQIKGESGKALDATVRTIQALGIDSCRLDTATLADDELVFTMRTSAATGAGLDGVNRIPTLGQQVEFFESGDRKFVGHAVEPEVDMDRVTVTVKGPWHWMSRVPVSSVKGGTRDTGADGTRPSYVFPTQGLRESIQILNNYAHNAGVPIDLMTDEERNTRISTMFNVIKTTVSGKSWADALADLLAWCPDAVAWFDYSGSGLPKLNVTRRSAMSALTLTIGDGVTECKIRPRLDLEVQRVELHSMKRDTNTGLPKWARQAYGTAAAGKVQMVPVSGPDVAVLVPKDDFDYATIQTKAANFGVSDFFKYDPVLKAAKERYGKFLGYNASFNFTNWHDIIAGDIEEWMKTDKRLETAQGKKLKTKDLQVSGWVSGTYTNPGGLGGCAGYLKSIGVLTWDVGGSSSTRSFKLFVNFTVPVINWTFPKKVTVYKEWDYDFLQPPASLAENLCNAQNWVPWEGRIGKAADEVSGDNFMNKKIRLAGSLGACATMDALLKRVSQDIIGGRTTYTLGAPARTDFGTMVKRIQRQPADNIEYIGS